LPAANGIPIRKKLLIEKRDVFRHTEEVKPDLIVIDSMQTLHTDTLVSPAGDSISQICEMAAELHCFAKTYYLKRM